jgi:hypothetical protein
MVVHALRREFNRLGLGRLLVTAYTGVAAAPFGGPTILKLLNLSVMTKSKTRVRVSTPAIREKMCQKFKEECGAPVEEFAAVIIDEISFIDAGVFGHVDRGFGILLGTTEMDNSICGGLPVLLCGDNHQKPPPGGTPWYQFMVKSANEPTKDPLQLAADMAKNRGLNFLKSAHRVQLKRLMRAKDDPAFIDYQLQMRRTELHHPIPDEFLQQLRTVSPRDLEEDAAWRFAPIGVLSHIERDVINVAQLKAFGKAFKLPIFRWRSELVDGAMLEQSVRDEVYNHEPNLWSYFVEGAPVLLLENISSVRMLVNGTAGLLDSLTIANEGDLALVERAYNTAYSDVMVTLAEPPVAVNVVVGGTDDTPMLWHQVQRPFTSPIFQCNRNPTSLSFRYHYQTYIVSFLWRTTKKTRAMSVRK